MVYKIVHHIWRKQRFRESAILALRDTGRSEGSNSNFLACAAHSLTEIDVDSRGVPKCGPKCCQALFHTQLSLLYQNTMMHSDSRYSNLDRQNRPQFAKQVFKFYGLSKYSLIPQKK